MNQKKKLSQSKIARITTVDLVAYLCDTRSTRQKKKIQKNKKKESNGQQIPNLPYYLLFRRRRHCQQQIYSHNEPHDSELRRRT